MSRIVKVPDCMQPNFICYINGRTYSYPAGVEAEVPDEVATVIENHMSHRADLVPGTPPSGSKPGGASSWNDLTDKPFYEETTTVGGDTLTWRFNPEAEDFADTNVVVMGAFVKVSDAVVTMEDLTNGCSVNDGTHSYTFPVGEIIHRDGVIALPEAIAMFIAESIVGVDVEGLVFPESGIYTNVDNSDVSLTIPGYTGFSTTTTVVKTLDEKYMPESVATKEYVDTKLGVIENGTY